LSDDKERGTLELDDKYLTTMLRPAVNEVKFRGQPVHILITNFHNEVGYTIYSGETLIKIKARDGQGNKQNFILLLDKTKAANQFV